jgi:hypothetical protein
MNGLSYNRDREEEFVNNVITDAIINVGALLDAPQNISAMFLRYVAENPEFEEFNRIGLQKAIMDAEKRMRSEYLYSRELPSWERIEEKIPGIGEQIIEVIEEVKKEK